MTRDQLEAGEAVRGDRLPQPSGGGFRARRTRAERFAFMSEGGADYDGSAVGVLVDLLLTTTHGDRRNEQ